MRTSPTSIESFSQLNADKRDAQTKQRSGHAFKLVRVYTDKVVPNPHNPRHIDVEHLEQDAEFQDLVSSVRTHGVLQPILVRAQTSEDGETRYELVAGERRWRAAMAAELESVPAVISTFDDSQAQIAALVENLQRQDIRPIDEAQGFRTVMDSFDLSESKLGEMIGKSRSYVNNRLRLLQCDPLLVQELQLPDSPVSAQHALLLQGIEPAARGAFLSVIKETGAGYNKMLERKKHWDDMAATLPALVDGAGSEDVRLQAAQLAAQGVSREAIETRLAARPTKVKAAAAGPILVETAPLPVYAVNDLATIRLVSAAIAAGTPDPQIALHKLALALEADLKAVRRALKGI
ncbi:MAG: ParB/RepB/Spo0J family partition protein [Candidatus Sericytochromatia bacterium]|nr:ParB/RepB/Spo0J family partition protein [Candidatus Sericytochromatia bacterium]